MAKLIILVLFIFTNYLKTSESCEFSSYSNKNIPTFLQKFGDVHLLLPAKDGRINIPNNQEITAFCQNNFENLRVDGHLYNKREVAVKCKDNSIKIEVGQNINRGSYYGGGQSTLNCPESEPQTYEHPVLGCTKRSYVNAQIIKNIPIVFAEICHDLKTTHTEFVHYVIADRSPVLPDQAQYNPSWTSHIDEWKNVGIKSNIFNLKDSVKYEQLKSSIGHLSEIVDYGNRSLIPSGIFSPYFNEPNFASWTHIYWWSSLLKGNWKTYEDILKRMSTEVSLDIYAGTSGSVTYPSVGKCTYTEKLKFYASSKQKSVPLYVWNYVRQREMNNTADVVVIGINSPFFDVSSYNYTSLCNDICDSVDWLQPLKHTRRMSALGYVFCCNPNDVKGLLDGFPQEVSNIFETTTSTTTNIMETTTSNNLDYDF